MKRTAHLCTKAERPQLRTTNFRNTGTLCKDGAAAPVQQENPTQPYSSMATCFQQPFPDLCELTEAYAVYHGRERVEFSLSRSESTTCIVMCSVWPSCLPAPCPGTVMVSSNVSSLNNFCSTLPGDHILHPECPTRLAPTAASQRETVPPAFMLGSPCGP